MLARILDERRLTGTPLGAVATACAAVDDVTAWCLLLLVVVVIVKAEALVSAAWTIALALGFIVLMLVVIRPLVARAAPRERGRGAEQAAHGRGTDVRVRLGLAHRGDRHSCALRGAFLAGVAIPPTSRLGGFLRERLVAFSEVFLLPLFFALTGLRTQIGLLNDGNSRLLCVALIAVAIAGKLGGRMLAARWTPAWAGRTRSPSACS